MNPAIILDLATSVQMPEDGTISRTIHQSDDVKAIVFGFSAGQELSEHTASMPATLHFISGRAQVTLGDESIEAEAGTWVHMPAHLPHSIRAETPVVMLLTMIKAAKTQVPR